MRSLKQRVEVDISRTSRAKAEVAKAKRDMGAIQGEAKEAIALTRRAQRSRRNLATATGVAAAAASGGRRSGLLGVTGEGFQIAGLAKFSSTGLTLEGGELISKIGGRFLIAAAAGRAIEGATRGVVNIRDRLALGQDFGSAAGQAGLDTVRSISRGLAAAVGLEGISRNLISLIGGKSQEQASKMVEDFWDSMTLDATKDAKRKADIRAFREVAEEKQDKALERLKRDHFASRGDFLATMGVPMSDRFGNSDFNSFVEQRRKAESSRLDKVIEKQIQDQFFTG